MSTQAKLFKQKSCLISRSLLSFIIFGSYLSYAEEELTALVLSGYFIAIAVLVVGLVSQAPYMGAVTRKAALLLFAYFAATLLSVSYNIDLSVTFLGLIQELLYPVVLFCLIVTGFLLIKKSSSSVYKIIIGLSVLNFLAGYLGVLGVISSAGLFGDVHQGRLIFGTSFRSSNGLMSNVNYYASAQASLGMLYGLIVSVKKGFFKRRNWIVLVAILVSSLLGSSRGVLLSSFAALSYLLYFDFKRSSAGKWIVFLFLTSIALSAVFVFYESIFSLFRLEKGLNVRDDIWLAVYKAWVEQPILGWGLEGGKAMGEHSFGELEGKSAHSGYLHLLLKGGLLSFSIVYGLVFYFLYWSTKNRKLNFTDHFSISCVIFYFVNSLFRGYSLGGLGLVPVVAVLAISVLMYNKTSRGMIFSLNMYKY